MSEWVDSPIKVPRKKIESENPKENEKITFMGGWVDSPVKLPEKKG